MNKYYITIYTELDCQLKTVKVYAQSLTEVDTKIEEDFPQAIITAIIVTK